MRATRTVCVGVNTACDVVLIMLSPRTQLLAGRQTTCNTRGFDSMAANLNRISLNIFLAGAFVTLASTVQASDIKVMCDSPLGPALTKVIDVYRQQTHNQVSLVFDPSPAVKKRIEG